MIDLPFTGERFVPTRTDEIAYEHWHRYVFARAIAAGKDVLDAASGEGYGSAALAEVARSVQGVDLATDAVRYATARYGHHTNLRYTQASVAMLPFPDACFDVVVSFETIEHVNSQTQAAMLAEFRRVLRPSGVLLLSSPNKAVYSDERGNRNEFHLCELHGFELEGLLSRHFTSLLWLHQRLQYWSGIWRADRQGSCADAWELTQSGSVPYGSPKPMYYVVLAANRQLAEAEAIPRASLLTDQDDTVAATHTANTTQLIRQFRLVDELASAADRNSAHIQHLEDLVVQRDAVMANQAAEIARLQAGVSGTVEAYGGRTGLLQELVSREPTPDLRYADLAEQIRGLQENLIRANQESAANLHAQVACAEEATRLRDHLRELEQQGSQQSARVASVEMEAAQLRADVHSQSAELARRTGWGWWLRFPYLTFKEAGVKRSSVRRRNGS